MDELAWWENEYKLRAQHSDSPTLASKAMERSKGLHEVWHDMMSAQNNWRAWS